MNNVLRIVPPGLYAGRGHVVIERAYRAYRHQWVVIVSGFFEPLFYLLSLGAGLSGLVGTIQGPDGRALSYQAFIAPALLATSAMNGATYDATYNFFFKLRYGKIYDGMLATSLGPLDVAIGEISWSLVRGGMYGAAFLALIAAMGLTSSWWAVLMLPAALLVALAFGAVGMAATTYLRGIADFDYVQLAILPMFLFSGTFYNLSVYPAWARVFVEILPLRHAIVVLRSLSTGAVDAGILGHLLYFVVMAAIGLVITARRLDRLLLR